MAIDLRGKPSYEATGCPACKKLEKVDKKGKRLCDECGKVIPPYEDGRVPTGYQSQTIDHWHTTGTAGVPGYRVIKKTLCVKCYKEDYSSVYPKHKLDM